MDACHIAPQQLMKAHNIFCRSLGATLFSGLVLDYDGTLCGLDNRFDALDTNIARELTRLLKAAIPLGIATGRGKSVRKLLQLALPKAYWKQVVLGYYNGAECAFLDNTDAPDGTSKPCIEISDIANTLLSDEAITSLATITVRKKQISIVPTIISHLDILWRIIGTHLSHGYSAKMVQSSHSIDILAPDVTKRNVIKAITPLCKSNKQPLVLCIGDQGRWPGNDSDLLSDRYSLSVDTVSSDLKSCWNIAPAGYRGQQAALHYLTHIEAAKGIFRFRLSGDKRA